MLNQYRRRYLARLQTLLKEFYELEAAGSNAHIGAKNKLDGFIDAGKATFIVNNADLRTLMAVSVQGFQTRAILSELGGRSGFERSTLRMDSAVSFKKMFSSAPCRSIAHGQSSRTSPALPLKGPTSIGRPKWSTTMVRPGKAEAISATSSS